MDVQTEIGVVDASVVFIILIRPVIYDSRIIVVIRSVRNLFILSPVLVC